MPDFVVDFSRRLISYLSSREECQRVAAILAELIPTGKAHTPEGKEDAMSRASFLSVKTGENHYAVRITVGHFLAQYIVVPAKAVCQDTKRLRTNPKHADQTHVTERDPITGKALTTLSHSDFVNSCLTVVRGYTAGRMSWPKNHRSHDVSRHITTFPSLKDAREYALCLSIIHENQTIELAVSRRKENDAPYCVFHVKKAHPRMDLVARYHNGCEELLRDAEQMAKFTARCVLPTWSVTWEDPNGIQQHSYLQAASETEAWNIIYHTETEEDGSLVSLTGTKLIEVNQLDSGSTNEDADRNLVRMYTEWQEDRHDTNPSHLSVDAPSLDPAYAPAFVKPADPHKQEGASPKERNRRIKEARERIAALEKR